MMYVLRSSRGHCGKTRHCRYLIATFGIVRTTSGLIAVCVTPTYELLGKEVTTTGYDLISADCVDWKIGRSLQGSDIIVILTPRFAVPAHPCRFESGVEFIAHFDPQIN